MFPLFLLSSPSPHFPFVLCSSLHFRLSLPSSPSRPFASLIFSLLLSLHLPLLPKSIWRVWSTLSTRIHFLQRVTWFSRTSANLLQRFPLYAPISWGNGVLSFKKTRGLHFVSDCVYCLQALSTRCPCSSSSRRQVTTSWLQRKHRQTLRGRGNFISLHCSN